MYDVQSASSDGMWVIYSDFFYRVTFNALPTGYKYPPLIFLAFACCYHNYTLALSRRNFCSWAIEVSICHILRTLSIVVAQYPHLIHQGLSNDTHL